MEHREQDDLYRFFKKPWHKWLYLVLPLIELLLAWGYIRNYQKLAALGIYSEAALAELWASAVHQCLPSLMIAVFFLSVFFIGSFARSQRQFRRAEGIFCLVMGLVWLVLGLALRRLPHDNIDAALWLIMLAVMLILGGYYTWKYRRPTQTE